MAWDMGPVVAQLWKAEKEGPLPPATQPLDAGQLNTVGYVISRFGRLTGHDLELLSHAEDPWRTADASRPGGGTVRIDVATIEAFCRAAGGPEPDLPWPAAEDTARLAAGADYRREIAPVPVPDDLGELSRRLEAR